jgi:hypothetical protein
MPWADKNDSSVGGKKKPTPSKIRNIANLVKILGIINYIFTPSLLFGHKKYT